MPRPLALPQLEFSRPVEVDRIGAEGLCLAIKADASEREALARRFALVSLDRLEAKATIAPVSRNLLRVEASFEADVVQTCVVTLEPVPARLSESFSALFGEGGPGMAALLANKDGEDDPEPIEAGAIDLGETVAQHLALSLDPYPRKPGASVSPEYGPGKGEESRGMVKPFAGLGTLKTSRER